MKEPIFCPHCKSKDIVKNGFYKYKANAKEQCYLCRKEAGFYPRIISTDKCHIYDVLRKYRKIRHIHAHFETKFIPYNNTVLPVSQNRIERYHLQGVDDK